MKQEGDAVYLNNVCTSVAVSLFHPPCNIQRIFWWDTLSSFLKARFALKTLNPELSLDHVLKHNWDTVFQQHETYYLSSVSKSTKKALMTKPISNLDNQHDPEHSPGRIHLQELNNVVP